MSKSIGLLFLLISLPFTANAADPAVAQQLQAKVRAFGEVNIIVDIAVTEAAERAHELLDDAARVSAMTEIQSRLLAQLQNFAPEIIHRMKYTPQVAMKVNEGALVALLANPMVSAVHENRLSRPMLDRSVKIIYPKYRSRKWQGQGTAVAIVDTGVKANHSFFQNRVNEEACYSGIDGGFPGRVASVCPGGAFSATGPGSAKPPSSSLAGYDHGTHVAGIAAGGKKRARRRGVAPKAHIIGIQVFSKFNFSLDCGATAPCLLSAGSDQMKGLERVFALRNTHNIAAVNMSLGGGQSTGFCNDPLAPMIKLLKSAGIATVIASGNNGFNNAVSFPGCVKEAITVGATGNCSATGCSSNGYRNRAFFSNSGKPLDFYAPGTAIKSSVAIFSQTESDSAPAGDFDNKSGTSMATPHVAGAWAVMKSKRPNASVAAITKAFKATDASVAPNGAAHNRRLIRLAKALKKI